MTNYKHLLVHHGLTKEDYEEMLAGQNNRCAICAREFGSNLRPVVDHDHENGLIRGLLCYRCNRKLSKDIHESFRDERHRKYLENAALCQHKGYFLA
jgi:hypothetical protein